MNKLDTYASAYEPSAVTALENQLILTWYPKRILRRLPNSIDLSLLELGVGHGYTTLAFNEVFQRHVVLEGSRQIIKQFRNDHKIPKPIDIVETYFEKYETDEHFDVIIMGFILEHVDDPNFIVQHYKKYLKKNGRLFVAVPNARCLNRRIGMAMGKINDIYELNKNDMALGHKRNFCCDTLCDLITKQGFSIKCMEGIYLKPLPVGYMQMMPEFQENLSAMCEVGVDFPELSVAILVEAQIND